MIIVTGSHTLTVVRNMCSVSACNIIVLMCTDKICGEINLRKAPLWSSILDKKKGNIRA
jgi:hypothetical protein